MKPELLILSGMHGDEYEVIRAVRQTIDERKDSLPEYLFIPEVSPSAVEQKTRKNVYGHDVNRQFFDPPADPEVKSFMDKLTGHHFALSVNFHEDPDLTSTFYLYDSAQMSEEELLQLRSQVIEAGAGLHTGVDDPLDANLGFHVEKGYVSTPYDVLPQDAGFSWVWFAKHGITDRSVEVEIPGKASMDLKRKLVSIIFDTIPSLKASSVA